jgi:hypothetical protein
LLSTLIYDSDEEVQKLVAGFLRRKNIFRKPALREIAVQWVGRPGFAQHPGWLVHALRQHPDSLLSLAPLFSAVCERLATDMARVAQDRRARYSFELDEFVPLLLRLYEQAEQERNRDLRNDCLNWWDRLLEARIGAAHELLSKLDLGTAPAL